jgi:hypothetical protein
MNNIEYLETQRIYNERKLYEGDKNVRPFWQLTDKEQEYYKWLFNRDNNK